jgi:hypothetical protein
MPDIRANAAGRRREERGCRIDGDRGPWRAECPSQAGPATIFEQNMGSRYTAEQTEFMVAMDRYKRMNRRPFPTWSEVLSVLKTLGYARAVEPDAAALERLGIRG